MIISPIQFASCFMFLSSILLLGVIYGRFHWILKAVLVVSSLLFCTVAYKGYQNTLGYPVFMSPPDTFRFYYAIVNEPNEYEKGSIFIWISFPHQKNPRVIEIPYSKKSRDMMAEAKERVKKGEVVYMAKNKKNDEGQDGDKSKRGDKSGKGGSLQSNGGSNTVPYHLDDETLDFIPPPDTLPKKMID